MKKRLSMIFSCLLMTTVPGALAFGQQIKQLNSLSSVISPIAQSKQIGSDRAGLPTIYGSVVYCGLWNYDHLAYGLYDITAQQGTASLLFEGPYASDGGVCINNTYYATQYVNEWGVEYMMVKAYDLETGEKLRSWEIYDLQVKSYGEVFDPSTETVYGLNAQEDGKGCQLCTISYGDEVIVTPIANIEGYWNTLAVDKTGQLYGISYDFDPSTSTVTKSYLNKIDKNSGEVTVIGDTGMKPQFSSSGCIDPKTNRMYWNVCSSNGSSILCEVNLETGEATPLFEFVGGDEIMGMFVPVFADDKAPAALEDFNIAFENGSLSGVANIKMPTTLYDDSSASGLINITILANEEIIYLGEAAYGEEIIAPVTVSESGKYTFTAYASNSVGNGPKTKIKDVWVGPDTPESTTASLTYENGTMYLSWLPVEASINGGYLDLGHLTYRITRYPDEIIVADGLSTTSFSEPITEPYDLTLYHYDVVAQCNGLESQPSVSNIVALGAINPPFDAIFNPQTRLNGWTVIDNNSDNKTWNLSSAVTVSIPYSSVPMDDWLITPPLRLEEGKAYCLCFKTYSYGNQYPEKLEVKYGAGNTIDEMTNTLLEPTIINWKYNDAKTYEIMMCPENSGKYYVGFHGLSDASQAYLYLSEISVQEGISALAPDAPTDIKIIPNENGEFRATINFKAPNQSINGMPLNNLTKIEVVRDNETVFTFNSVVPGEELSVEDDINIGGDVTYSIIGYNDEGKGIAGYGTAFIGYDLPSAPEYANITLTHNVGEAVVEWTPVVTDVNGLSIPADRITYNVSVLENNMWTVLAENIKDTSYSFQAVETNEQKFIQCAVVAVMDATSISNMTITDATPVGTPYKGLDDSFSDGMASYQWGIKSIGDGNVYILNEVNGVTPQNDDNGMLTIFAYASGDGAQISSGIISLEDMFNPTLSFDLYYYYHETGGIDINDLSVEVREVSIGTINNYQEVLHGTVDELCGGEHSAWHKFTISLDEYANKDVQFRITGITHGYAYIFFDNIKVETNNYSGIRNIQNENVSSVKVTSNGIEISNSRPMPVYVAGLDGKVIYSDAEVTETVIPVNSGIYVVISGDVKRKIIVK